MIAFNHGMSGMLIATVVPAPLAIPLAFASHFLLDLVPHYGLEKSKRDSSIKYKLIVFTDISMALLLNLIVLFKIPHLEAGYHQWIVLVCGWVAVGPDLGLVYYSIRNSATMQTYSRGPFSKIHEKMQRYERPAFAWQEFAVTIILISLMFYKF